MEAGKEFWLSAVEAELTERTDVHQALAALLFRVRLLDRLTLRLVLHDDDDVVRLDLLPTLIHLLHNKNDLTKLADRCYTD